MDAKFLLLVAVLILSACVVEARRRGNAGRRRGGSTTDTRYSWTRELTEGNSVAEEAIVPDGRNLVYLKSIDDALIGAGYAKASALYDFSGPAPIVSIIVHNRPRLNPCYIMDTAFSYNEVIELLVARNNTQVPLGATLTADGSAAPLSRLDSRTLMASNPALRRACHRGRIVRVSTLPATPGPDTTLVKVLTLDSVLELVVQSSSNSPGPSRGGHRGRGRG